jgi:hypothetical protein
MRVRIVPLGGDKSRKAVDCGLQSTTTDIREGVCRVLQQKVLPPVQRNRKRAWSLIMFTMLSLAVTSAQDLNLSPTRPTIANSAAIQSRGVLQIESGYDAYPLRVPGNQQTVDSLFTYTPLARLRMDFGWSAFNHQEEGGVTTNGVGTIQIGGKLEMRKEQYHRVAPGVAVQYEAELPTASQEALQGYGQQAIFLLNHHYGKNGDLDVIVNGSLVQSDCQTRARCTYGGQQSMALSYHLQKDTRLYIETFGQNTSQSNTPPGTYVFGGFYHQFSDAFGLDGGMRFGVSDHSASIGTTIGVVFGKRLRTEVSPRSHGSP